MPQNKLKAMFDLDGVLCDWQQQYDKLHEMYPNVDFPQSLSGFFDTMPPVEEAVRIFLALKEHPDVECYILTAPSNKNPHSYTGKMLWVQKMFGMDTVENLIITSDKSLVLGDVLVDDKKDSHNQDEFMGNLIHIEDFATTNWDDVYDNISHLAELKKDFGCL